MSTTAYYNDSSTTTEKIPYQQTQAGGDVINIMSSVVLAFTLYLFIVLLIYEKRMCSSKTDTSSGGSQKYGKWLRILCILSAGFSMCNGIRNLIFFNREEDTDAGCTAQRNVGVAFLTMLDVTIYLFLWLRQHIVHKTMNFASKVTRCIANVMQWVTLSLIIGIFLVMMSLILCCRRYIYDLTEQRCSGTTPGEINSAIGYVWTVGSITLHCTLVLMFVFPLIRLNNMRKRRFKSAASSNSSLQMTALVRRCLLVSLACVTTDITVMMVTAYGIDFSHLSHLRHFLYNLNVFINSTLIVMSFKEWPLMLFPWLKPRERNMEVGAVVRGATSTARNVLLTPKREHPS